MTKLKGFTQEFEDEAVRLARTSERTRRVVGWAVGDRLHRRLAIAALQTALTMRRPPEGPIHHSDRGSQYCSVDYQADLRRHGVRMSMSGKGN